MPTARKAPTKSPAKPRPRLAAKPASKPQYQVVDGLFIAQTSEGEVKIRLSFKTKLLRALRRDPDRDEIDQFFGLLEGIGDQKTIAQLDELDFIEEALPLIQGFFDEFAKAQGTTLGESTGSSS